MHAAVWQINMMLGHSGPYNVIGGSLAASGVVTYFSGWIRIIWIIASLQQKSDIHVAVTYL